MSVIEDVRQVIQDLLAPQLKSLDTKLTALDASVTQRFNSAESSVAQRFTSAEIVASARHDALMAKVAQVENTMASNHEAIIQKLDLERRLERVERGRGAETATDVAPPRPDVALGSQQASK